MDAYLYHADLYSAEGLILRLLRSDTVKPADVRACGFQIEPLLDRAAARLGVDRADENTFDSDDFPKGPYADGGGESDSPQACAETRRPLDNPLTPDGSAYVKQAFKAAAEDERLSIVVIQADWQASYPNEYAEACEEQDREGGPPVQDFAAALERIRAKC